MAKAFQEFVFVDISEKPAQAKVVREGYKVPPARFDPQKKDFFIEDLIKIPPAFEPRVINQSIAAGTRVTPGTVVDLVLAPKSIIPFEIFENVHADLAQATLSRLDPTLNNARARQILLTYENAADVPQTEKAELQAALIQSDIGIDEADPNRNFEKAFNAARNALAFR